jgi:hypothetical protein
MFGPTSFDKRYWRFSMKNARGGIALVALMLAWTSLGGCALVRGNPKGVPVDSRPTPGQPGTAPAETGEERPGTAGTSTQTKPPATVQDATPETDRKAVMRRIVADTTEASAAVSRCAKRKLLPDQESSFDSARGLLIQTRAALDRDELWRAESLARKARQVASALYCP